MTTITDIYQGAIPFINSLLRKELIAQGHHLTGALEESFDAEISSTRKQDLMEGMAAHYAEWVNNGFPAASASMKQFPFVYAYFLKRGLSEPDAKGAAFGTIRKWMKEGMPTQASKAYSSTGSRTNMIENAFAGAESKIDDYLTDGFDFVVEERFQLEKSETI
ncbi:MAG TPA: hypothetical protein VK644_10490 [Chitinophagaceae bacterium]|nr:hypothetical protein [Chitinophagaceae bacterium]